MNIFKLKIKHRKTTFAEKIMAISRFWDKTYRYVFVIFFLVLAGFGGYIWYQSLYGGVWSADKKQQYLNSQEKSIVLKEREFNKALDDINGRKAEFEKEYQPVRDIFAPYDGANSSATVSPQASTVFPKPTYGSPAAQSQKPSSAVPPSEVP